METEIGVGDTVPMDELPDNQMNVSGDLEWLGDGVMVLSHDDIVYEFTFTHVTCIAVRKMDMDTGKFIEEEEIDDAQE